MDLHDVISISRLLLQVLCGSVLVLILGFVGLPLILAVITHWRSRDKLLEVASSLYVGRVWHTRLVPTHHGFQYPLFVFCLDLEEVDHLFGDTLLWPLSCIVSFRKADHLKNGEGVVEKNNNNNNNNNPCESPEKCEIAQRVLRLVAEKTNQKFQPTLEKYRVLIVTHLCYYGYCFNPVSLYYLQEKSTNQLAAVVAEVSNTPWNEMHCYVLHENSVDQVQVQESSSELEKQQSINYKWPKRFHVSPFMQMNYTYDWTFTNFVLHESSSSSSATATSKPQDENSSNPPPPPQQHADPLLVRASMKQDETGDIHFTAKVECFRQGIMPMRVAWQLICYPIYCLIIQVWIHYEAFRLFVKGVVFVPHPDDTETAISRAIASIMTPLFEFKDWMDQRLGRGCNASAATTSTSTEEASASSKLKKS